MISLLADGASTAFPAESTISTSPAGTCSVLAILAPTFAVVSSTTAAVSYTHLTLPTNREV